MASISHICGELCIRWRAVKEAGQVRGPQDVTRAMNCFMPDARLPACFAGDPKPQNRASRVRVWDPTHSHPQSMLCETACIYT